ncbi:MAG: hypothetical protein SPD90_03350 [Intestinibacter sp.]|uniref:hypothetical protein n=1 Tax=Intestinibacter sp. TaxID=1965304 RepID=UPI002A817B25|nr:hypothetical protein [Intestinibacter sp.]MDY4574075.1 hypothetical protein [Intestinibacter sp.]
MKKSKKLAIALVVVLVPAIGFGFNYFKWSKEQPLSNHQTLTVKGDIAVTEVSTDEGLVPRDEICGSIGFNIESTAPSLLRVKVEASCSGDNGLKDVGVIEGLKDNWVYGGDDGYYYYTKAVNKTTQDSVIVQFADSIKFDAKNGEDVNDYQGKEISTKITAEMVQAKYGVFETEWNVKQGHPAYEQLKAASDAVTPSN